MPRNRIPKMKTNGMHLAQFAEALPQTLPLREQIQKISKHKGKMEKRLNKLSKLPHVSSNSNQVGARTPEVEAKILDLQRRITQAAFQIFAIQSKIKDPQFNRNSVSRPKSVQPDRGRIVFSRDGIYETKDHKGAIPKARPDDSIILEV